MRASGADTLIPATGLPWRSHTAALTEPTPTSLSPSLNANPRRRTSASSVSSAALEVIESGVSAGSLGEGYRPRRKSSLSQASQAFPTDVQCAHLSVPTLEATRSACGLSAQSMNMISLSCRTAQCAVSLVSSRSSSRNGWMSARMSKLLTEASPILTRTWPALYALLSGSWTTKP